MLSDFRRQLGYGGLLVLVLLIGIFRHPLGVVGPVLVVAQSALWMLGSMETYVGMDYQRAVAYTLILVGMFWNGTGAITLGILGTIRWDWIPVLLVGSLLGG